jgi:hypothetical protein
LWFELGSVAFGALGFFLAVNKSLEVMMAFLADVLEDGHGGCDSSVLILFLSHPAVLGLSCEPCLGEASNMWPSLHLQFRSTLGVTGSPQEAVARDCVAVVSRQLRL